MDKSLCALHSIISQTPLMEPVDAVKLAYQSEFGCGHLLAEETVLAQRIQAEIASAKEDPAAAPFAWIGGGLCRLNLRSAAVSRLSPLLLARMMQETALQRPGTLEGFQLRLEKLRQACGEGLFSFDLASLESYLSAYAKEGYPPVSHSPAYRAAYTPAYRVVLMGYRDALPLLLDMEERLQKHGKCLLVLDGDCGGGKTTLASLIAPLYQAQMIGMDEFFLPPEMRTPERLREPGGNVHYERFLSEVLAGLAEDKPFAYGSYDCHRGTMAARTLVPSNVTLIEGSYSHHPAFAAQYATLNALRAWIWVEPREQLRRLERRNPALFARFEGEWIPLEKAYLGAFDGQGHADRALESLPWEDDWVLV